MAKAGAVGEGVMMSDLKGHGVSEEKKKIFEEGTEYGKSLNKIELDEIWDMHFDLLEFVRDANFMIKEMGDAIGLDNLDNHFGKGFREMYDAIVEHAEAVTENLDEEEDSDEE